MAEFGQLSFAEVDFRSLHKDQYETARAAPVQHDGYPKDIT